MLFKSFVPSPLPEKSQIMRAQEFTAAQAVQVPFIIFIVIRARSETNAHHIHRKAY